MSRADELREQFLSFFEERGHKRVASSPLVPEGDPSLMFTNSGMVQFKNVFTGLEKRDYKRAVTAQKCLRAGGKHNDLENVGYTKRHHTFFEMLGNFSFGDYFKEEAIKYAWDFLVKELELDKSKLIATVYHEDEEAFGLWKKFLPENKIIRIATSDNFWQMGDSGPCGPCSEIFYDNGEREEGEVDGVEIWNLVFMQYDLQNGKKTPLPKPCVDTGMGLERMLAVLEGKTDNYDTSLFKPLVETVCDRLELKGSPFHKGSKRRSSIKVIADHARACAFMIEEGIIPSNEGEGYVLRRILRRAMRHIRRIDQRSLRFHSQPIFNMIVLEFIDKGNALTEALENSFNSINHCIRTEETFFITKLNKGMNLLEEEIAKNPNMKTLNGETAFKLYDTFGFPLDLIEDALHDRGIVVDKVGFNAAMEQQKARGRAAWIGSGEEPQKAVLFMLAEKIQEKTIFVEDKKTEKTQIKAIIKNGQKFNIIKEGEEGIVITERTPFYAESGGQQGDCGFITLSFLPKNKNFDTNPQFEVHDTKYGHDKHFIFHHGRVKSGELEDGNIAYLQVDIYNRHKTSVHHSATHLLHTALRQVLGDHVQQRGSQITPEKLRFDFNHHTPLTENNIKAIEAFINERCLEALPITWEEMSREEADKKGATALFGEKYGEKVRVVTIGKGQFFLTSVSVELCGGTHAKTTAEIGIFHIISESSVASGIRRIEAVAGGALVDFLKEKEQQQQHDIESLREQNKKIQAELKHALESLLLLKSSQNSANSKNVGKNSNMVRNLGTLPPKDLKPLANRILQQDKLPAIALAAEFEGKVSLLLALSPQSAQQHSAVTLLEPAQKILQAKGGGKPALAQIGSSITEKLPQALKALEQKLEQEFKQAFGKI